MKYHSQKKQWKRSNNDVDVVSGLTRCKFFQIRMPLKATRVNKAFRKTQKKMYIVHLILTKPLEVCAIKD